MAGGRRGAVTKIASRFHMEPWMLYILVVGLEAAVGWFVMGKVLDEKLQWSFVAILAVVLMVAIGFECLYEFWLAGDNVGRRSGGQ